MKLLSRLAEPQQNLDFELMYKPPPFEVEGLRFRVQGLGGLLILGSL